MDQPYRKFLSKYLAGIFWVLIFWGNQKVKPEIHQDIVNSIGLAETGLVNSGVTDKQLVAIQDWCKDQIKSGKYLNEPNGYAKIAKLIASTPEQ